MPFPTAGKTSEAGQQYPLAGRSDRALLFTASVAAVEVEDNDV